MAEAAGEGGWRRRVIVGTTGLPVGFHYAKVIQPDMKQIHDTLRPGKITLFLIIILFIAFALRFSVFYQMGKSPIADMVIEDSKTYNDWGREIARGNWLGQDVFHALPLYPYFLGLIYAICGYHLQLVKFIQVILGTLNCYLLFRLGRRLFNPSLALLATLFMAVYGWLIVYDSAILSPVLIIFFNLSLLLFLDYIREKKKNGLAWLGAGLLAGLTAAASAHILLFIPLAVVWLLVGSSLPGRARLASALSFLLGFILIIGGITFRNWYTARDFVPLTAHGGINFFIGNNPHSRGVFEPPPILRSGGATLQEDSVKIAQKALGRKLKPSEVSSYWFHQGLNFIKEKPFLYLQLLVRKFVIFWDGLEIADVIHPYFFRDFAPVLKFPLLIFRVIAPLALLGILLSWPARKRLVLLYLFLASHIFSSMLYFINSRYRLPLVPFLLLFAAYPFCWWWEKIRNRKLHLVITSLIPLLFFIYFVNPIVLGKDHARFVLNLGAGHNHLGTYYSLKGNLKLALKEFREALRLEPYRAEAHYNLANIHLKLKNYEAARSGYQEAIRLNPFYESAHLALGYTYEYLGEKEKARQKYLEIIANLPHNIQAYLRLEKLYLAGGDLDKAIAIAEKCLSLNPAVPAAYFHLALAYEKKGNFHRAKTILEKALTIAPREGKIHFELGKIFIQDLPDREKALFHLEKASLYLPDSFYSHLYLGDFYYQLGEWQEALEEWTSAEKIYPGDPTVAKRLRRFTLQPVKRSQPKSPL